MERQIYSSQTEKIEVYTSEKAHELVSSIHPVSRNQIIFIPELQLSNGNKVEDLKEKLEMMINRPNSKEIIRDIIKEAKAFMYSYIP